MNQSRLVCLYVISASIVTGSPCVLRAHEAHMLIGRSSAGQLMYNPSDGVQDDALTVLALIPPGGPIAGYSASIPGFSMVVTSVVPDDCHPLAPGADIWVELIAVDAPLLIIETPSYRIVNEQNPPELRIGGEAGAHVHPLWLLDTTDPAFDPGQCIWKVDFVLRDKGTTGYWDSDVLTFRFSAGRIPCPADFDCDADVDLDDHAVFEACATGPAMPYDPDSLPAGCTLIPDDEGVIPADFDRDGDVDHSDFGRFQRCVSGPGVQSEPACVE